MSFYRLLLFGFVNLTQLDAVAQNWVSMIKLFQFSL